MISPSRPSLPRFFGADRTRYNTEDILGLSVPSSPITRKAKYERTGVERMKTEDNPGKSASGLGDWLVLVCR